MRRCSLALLLLSACEETNNQGWLVDRTRVLGVRIEAQAEPSRAAIGPGERMRARWLVGAPNGTGRLRWSYAVCLPVVGNYPEPRCDRPVLGTGSGMSEGELVTMELPAPPADAIGDARELQLLAAFCDDADVALEPVRFTATCASGAAPRLASGTIRLAVAGPNASPELASDALLFDGAPLTGAARAGTPCASETTSPVVVAGSKHQIALRFSGAEREPLPGTREGVESVLASHVVNAGELERQYSMLDPAEAAPKTVSMRWTAPSPDAVPEGGRLTELFVVLRDGRGGSAFARRTVCVRR